MQKQHPHQALFWAGIDLAKATFEAALWGHDAFRAMRVRSFGAASVVGLAIKGYARGHSTRGVP